MKRRAAIPPPSWCSGRAADAEVLIRAIESGAIKKIWPIGILSPSSADQGQAIRGITVLGALDDLERVVADLEARGARLPRVVMTPTRAGAGGHAGRAS